VKLFLRAACAIAFTTALSLTLFSCDLSAIFGKNSQYITGFVLKAKDNPGLSSDIAAAINGTDINLVLPYLYAVDGAAITPTVSLSANASVSPSGSYVAKDGMNLVVTKGGTNYTYTVNTGVDPSTLTATPPLQAYSVDQAQNGSLSRDYHAVIYGNGVYLTLPYSLITSGLAITPTVGLQSGYTISPSGSYTPADLMTLNVTNSATSALTQYTLHVAADPATSPALPPLQTFTYTAALNPTLSSDIQAAVSGLDVYITLPYQTLETQQPLTPTVTLESHYTITPSGSYVPIDGMTLALVNSQTLTTTSYTLHVAVSTSTIP